MRKNLMHCLSIPVIYRKRLLSLASLMLLVLTLIFVLPAVDTFDAEAAYTGEPGSTIFYNHAQIVDRLNHIESISDGEVELEIIGQSNQGRDIYMATIGEGDKPVLIFTQQHGDEPHGTQAALNLLEDLVTLEDPVYQSILEELTVHIIPRLNPDGGEPGTFTRQNVDPLAPSGSTTEGLYCNYQQGWDINRYHTIIWDDHPLRDFSEFYIMTDELGLLMGRTFNGSVAHSGEEGILVDCGDGMTPEDFPPEVAGNIALVERNGTFNDKGANAEAAGATGFVLYESDPNAEPIPRLTFSNPPNIPATVIARDKALQIINHGTPVTGQFVTNTFDENPVTEALVLREAVSKIEPAWIIDSHNQGSWLSCEGKAVTSSLGWGAHPGTDDSVIIETKQMIAAMMEHMEQFEEAELTFYAHDTRTVAKTARAAYSQYGIPTLLMEHWNNYTNPRMARMVINHAYEQMFIVLKKTADGSLYSLDPDMADNLGEKVLSISRSEAEDLIQPLLPPDDELKEAAIQEAITAIDAIPAVLTMEDMMEVRMPRARVESAVELGASFYEIPNLNKLVEAEEAIFALYSDNYMRQSFMELPPPPSEYISGYETFVRNKHERWYTFPRSINGIVFLPEYATFSYSYSSAVEPRWAEYDVSGRGYTHVKGYVGVYDGSTPTEYPTTFQIHGDGDLLYEKRFEYGESDFYLIDVEGVERVRFGYYTDSTTGRPNRLLIVEPQFLIPINDEMLDVIAAAEAAIDGLPEVVSILDEPDVESARALVEEAFDLGVEKEGRIANLDKLIAAEETIHNYYHELYEIDSLLDLGDPGPGNSNQPHFSDFEDQWQVHEVGHLRSLNLRYYEPLHFYSRNHPNLDADPPWTRWDISDKDYTYVEGYLGIADSSTQLSYPLIFTISGDGVVLLEEVLEYGREAIFYRLDLEGVDVLRFEWTAEETDSDNRGNRPVFIEPQFLHSPKKAQAIAEAEAAVEALPDEVTLEDKPLVLEARAKVENALAIGVQEEDIDNYEDYLKALLAIWPVEPELMYGDINGDGAINVQDVIMAMQQVLGLIQLGEEQETAADVDGNGTINVEDVILIMQRVLGLIEKFPVED